MRALLVVLAMGFIQVIASGQQPVRLTVLTYNLHHCAGTDGKLDVARIAAVIAKTNPDLVALQEVDNNTNRTGHVDQAAELGKLTKMHSAFGKAMAYDGGYYGDGILSKYEIIDAQGVELPHQNLPKHEPRVALAARVKLPNGQELRFITTHLDQNRWPNDRSDQAKMINESFAKVDLAILGGDLNATPDTDALKIFRQEWSDSAADHPEPTIPSNHPRKKIDYVLYKPAQRWHVIETQVVDEEVASDHRPFLAVLELK